MPVTPIYPSEVYSLVRVKQGDTARLIYDDLSINGTPINLETASVILVWNDPCIGVTTRKSASVVEPTSGSVSYQLTSDDLATTGSFLLEWEVEFTGSIPYQQLSVPTDGYLKLNIIGDLDPS